MGLQTSAGQFRKRLSVWVVFSLFIISTDGELMRFLPELPSKATGIDVTRYFLRSIDEAIRYASENIDVK